MAVLVVESDRALAGCWAAGLSQRGFRVTLAHGVAEAIARVRRRPPRLLIGSLLVEGESLLPIIVAAEYRREDLATILLSDSAAVAHADFFGRLASLRCVLGKPVRPGDLIDIAEHLLVTGGERPVRPPRPSVCASCAIAAICSRTGAENEKRRRHAAPAVFDGAGDGIRTHDPNLGKVVLYP